jgi:hypothetical protein
MRSRAAAAVGANADDVSEPEESAIRGARVGMADHDRSLVQQLTAHAPIRYALSLASRMPNR